MAGDPPPFFEVQRREPQPARFGEVAQGWTAPHVERLGERIQRTRVLAGLELRASRLVQRGEARRVEIESRRIEAVPAGDELNIDAELLAQARDVRLQRMGSICRLLVTPQVVDQRVDGYGAVLAESEPRQRDALTMAAQWDPDAVDVDLDRAQQTYACARRRLSHSASPVRHRWRNDAVRRRTP